MKTLKYLIFAFALTLFSIENTNAKTFELNEIVMSKYDTAEIKVSSRCDMCKERIEKAMAFEKGVVHSNLDLEVHVLTVVFKPRKTDADKIRKAITKVGYDADELPANEKAYKNLPACCKKDAPPH